MISNFKIDLTVSPTSIDTVGGQVVATAIVTDTTGAAAPGQVVKFSVIPSTQAAVSPGMDSVTTDSNGKAIAFIIPGDTPTTTNVIVQATVKTAMAQAVFQIARGTGKISFDSAPYTNSKTLDFTAPTGFWLLFNQIPITLTDASGNARVGVPVTLSVFSHASNLTPGGTMTIDYLLNPQGTSQDTIVTDSAGKAIFTVSDLILAPDPGGTNGDSFVFMATTNDPIPIVSYGGLVDSLSRNSQ